MAPHVQMLVGQESENNEIIISPREGDTSDIDSLRAHLRRMQKSNSDNTGAAAVSYDLAIQVNQRNIPKALQQLMTNKDKAFLSVMVQLPRSAKQDMLRIIRDNVTI